LRVRKSRVVLDFNSHVKHVWLTDECFIEKYTTMKHRDSNFEREGGKAIVKIVWIDRLS
jgi:hypothetical protein